MISLEQGNGAVTTHGAVAFVDAPTALAGFQLVIRLASAGAENTQADAGGWLVRVPLADLHALRSLLAGVQLWLGGEQMTETCVRVGGDVYRVDRARFDGEEIDER